MENMTKKEINRPIAIKMCGVKKRYRLGQIGGRTLRADLQSWWARVRKKEDPNVRIGVDQRLIGQTFMALNGIDLTIYQGEAVGIIGGNGAGKSTMLKLLSRVTAPTEGEIDIYGRVASMLEVGTGFNGEMTGRENVYLNGAILGMSKAEIDAKMEEIIEFSEVRDFIDTPVKRYSSGMYVKLAFSVAAHLNSEIMIMDEVLAVGDMAFQKKCLDKMRQAAKQDGRTVLYVSHNMNTIRRLCDRCIVLNQGKVIFEGDVEPAIALYSNVSQSLPINYNYDDEKIYPRSENERRELRFRSMNFFVGEQNVWKKNTKVKAKMRCTINENCKNVGLRFEVRAFSGDIVGTMFTAMVINEKKGDADFDLTFNTIGLAPGKYYVDMLAFVASGYNTQIVYDRVGKAFLFEIVEDTDSEIAWLPQYWGHVQLGSVELEKGSMDEKESFYN